MVASFERVQSEPERACDVRVIASLVDWIGWTVPLFSFLILKTKR